MKQSAAVIICFIISFLAKGQSLSPSVVASSGDVFKNSSGSLEWTLGEITTETYHKDFFLTQGFQQSFKTPETGTAIWVYPNPTPDQLKLRMFESGDYLVDFYNILGQKVLTTIIKVTAQLEIHQIDLKNLDAAVYILRIQNTTTGRLLTTKVDKL
jgi:hypothetical protein